MSKSEHSKYIVIQYNLIGNPVESFYCDAEQAARAVANAHTDDRNDCVIYKAEVSTRHESFTTFSDSQERRNP